MRFAVADEHRAVGVAKDTVRTRHFALERIAIRAVALLIEPGDEFEIAGLHVDHANGVALAVGEPDVALGIDRNALRSA